MEVKINVDESKFKDVLENELAAFDKEELHSIIKEAMIEVLHNDDVIKDFLVVKRQDYYSSREIWEPGPVLMEAAKNINLTDELQDLCTQLINALKENHKALLEDLLLKTLVKGITQNYNFQEDLKMTIHEVLYKINQN